MVFTARSENNFRDTMQESKRKLPGGGGGGGTPLFKPGMCGPTASGMVLSRFGHFGLK